MIPSYVSGGGKGGAKLIADTYLAAPASTITISGLDGDAHGAYRIEGHLLILADIAAHEIFIRPNGTTSNLRRTSAFAGGGSEATWTMLDATGFSTLTAPVGFMFTAEMRAARTLHGVAFERTIQMYGTLHFNQANYTIGYSMFGVWQETATNLTSLEFVDSGTDKLLAGSHIRVWAPSVPLPL